MTVDEVKKRLLKAKDELKRVKAEIHHLKMFFIDMGINTNQRTDLAARNKEIYNRYLNGEPRKEIVKQYKLSGTSIRRITQRMEKITINRILFNTK